MKNNPALLDKTADAIMKIQEFGYVFCFDTVTEKYQASNQKGEVEHEFDNWEQIIAFAGSMHDKRQ